ncbi:MAG: WXG100 family type VII secretion target [Micrococcaceae bacterium]
MAQYQVDSEAVQQASQKVRASIEGVRGEIQSMGHQLTQLQSTWTGQASQAFQSVISQWQTTQKSVENDLEAINQALNTAGVQYASTEAQNAMMFSS